MAALILAVPPREDPDRDADLRRDAARDRVHHAAEAAADHDGVLAREQAADLLGRLDVVPGGVATSAHGDVHGRGPHP